MVRTFFQNNGWISQSFDLSQGVGQGCPLSPYLFSKCCTKNWQKSKRIHVEKTGFKISPYADDTTPILDGSRQSFLGSLKVLERFGQFSRLQVNYSMIKQKYCRWIGSSNQNAKMKVKHKNIEWEKEWVKALGIWFTLDPRETQ